MDQSLPITYLFKFSTFRALNLVYEKRLKYAVNTAFLMLLLLCSFTRLTAQCNISTQPTITTGYNCLAASTEMTLQIKSPNTTPPYTITSVPVGINAVMTGTIIYLSNFPAKDYKLLITAPNGCTATTQGLYSVLPTSSINIVISNTNVTCPGGSNGAVSAYYTGGAPYTWQWSTGATSSVVTGLAPGVYTVSITNVAACTATSQVTVYQPQPITALMNPTFIPCYGAGISSTLSATGGNAPFNYTVNGTPVTTTNNVAGGITAGVQNVLVKDNKGCVSTNTVLLTQAAQQMITPSLTQPNCHGESNGAIQVSVSGPVAGYSYSWSVGNSASSVLNNIPAGNYSVFVTDASNCITTSLITLPQPGGMSKVPLVKKENCSAADGAFTLMVSGGSLPYTYTTIPGNIIGNVAGGLSTGSYTTFIKDAKGCKDSTVTYVGNLSTVSLHVLTVTPVECYDQCNGSVILNIQNAAQPVSYSITGRPATTNSVVGNLCAGFYLVKALDAIGCPAFDTINFPQLPVFSYSAAAPPAICIGRSAQLKASATGGSGMLSYIWQPGNLNGQTISVEPTTTTVFSLNVYDSKGCTRASYPVQVNVNPPLSINVSGAAAGICPGTTAQITPSVSGGDGNYEYSWMPGGSKGASIFVENITVPVYTLTVGDACGSPKLVKEIEIKLHPVIRPQFVATATAGCMPHCVTFVNVTPRSGNAIWNYGDKPFEQKGDTTRYCYEKPGEFNLRLMVTDSNSCKTAYTYTGAITVKLRPDARFFTDPGVITLNNSDNVLLKSTTSANAFRWFVDGQSLGDQSTARYTFQDTGCYTVKLLVQNENHCRDSAMQDICVFEGFNFYVPQAFTPNNDGLNDVLLPKGTGWMYEGYKFEVFNRWGVKVFSTSDVSEGWNGGAALDPLLVEVYKADLNDMYIWRAVVTDNQGEEHRLSGRVVLVR